VGTQFAVTQTDGLTIVPPISEPGYTGPFYVTEPTACPGFTVTVMGQVVTLSAPAAGGSCVFVISGAPGAEPITLDATWTAAVTGGGAAG